MQGAETARGGLTGGGWFCKLIALQQVKLLKQTDDGRGVGRGQPRKASRGRWERGGGFPAEWTAEGGRKRPQGLSMARRVSPVSGNGACWRPCERAGFRPPIWVAPQELFNRLLSQRVFPNQCPGTGACLFLPAGRRERSAPWLPKRSPTKFTLSEDELPRTWYNVARGHEDKTRAAFERRHRRADGLRRPAPSFLRRADPPGDWTTTRARSRSRPRSAIFTKCTALRRLCAPTAWRRRLGTPAKIYYKFEGNNTSGSHKLNSAIAQGVLCQAAGPERRDDRDRRGSVGHGALDGLRLPGAGLQGVYGQGLV